jgi:bifunctional ADP-heptose synthase (sugar kinase/adenylyltransferase)
MLAAPASIAAPPSPKGKVCWSPAVPPPPVCGAAVTVTAGVAVTVTVTVAVAVADAEADELAGVLVELLGAGLLAADELAPVGGWWVGDDTTEDGEQPATATKARMAKTPKPMTVSFALSTVPGVVTRTVM